MTTHPSSYAPYNKPAALTKTQALQRVHSFKRWIAVATIAGFGVFAGLAVEQTANAQQNSQQDIQDQQSGGNNFFNQQGQQSQSSNPFGPSFGGGNVGRSGAS
jgi:hypothetical protein